MTDPALPVSGTCTASPSEADISLGESVGVVQPQTFAHAAAIAAAQGDMAKAREWAGRAASMCAASPAAARAREILATTNASR